MDTNSSKSRVKSARLRYQDSFTILDIDKVQNEINYKAPRKDNRIPNFQFLSRRTLFLNSLIEFLHLSTKINPESSQSQTEDKSNIAYANLRALRARMNLHFVFNALNSINHFIINNEKQNSCEYLAKFSSLIRATLIKSEKNHIPLEEDLELIRTYLDMELIRLDNNFKYQIRVDRSINPNNTVIPPGLLQPFIENSIWHGISSTQKKGLIKIMIRKKGETLILSVDDNGLGGISPVDINKSRSLGIKITKNRIKILNQLKNGMIKLNFINKFQGVRVEIKLPFEKAF